MKAERYLLNNESIKGYDQLKLHCSRNKVVLVTLLRTLLLTVARLTVS